MAGAEAAEVARSNVYGPLVWSFCSPTAQSCFSAASELVSATRGSLRKGPFDRLGSRQLWACREKVIRRQTRSAICMAVGDWKIFSRCCSSGGSGGVPLLFPG